MYVCVWSSLSPAQGSTCWIGMWRFYSPSHFQLPRWVRFVEAKGRPCSDSRRFHFHAVLKTCLFYLFTLWLNWLSHETKDLNHYVIFTIITYFGTACKHCLCRLCLRNILLSVCVWCIKVLLESFAYLNLNKSTARFCTCMPIQLCVACKCLCSSTSWSLIKCTFTPTPHVKHSNTTCPVLSCWTLLASLVLLSLTASRKAPSWESWVSAGYSDLQRQMCRQLLFLFVKAFWHGITLQRHVFSSKPPSSGFTIPPFVTFILLGLYFLHLPLIFPPILPLALKPATMLHNPWHL